MINLTPNEILNLDQFKAALDRVALDHPSFVGDGDLGIDEESLQHVALTLAFPALQAAQESSPDTDLARVANLALIAATQIAFAAGVFFERERIKEVL